MTAPTYHGGAEPLREHLEEMLCGVARKAALGAQHAQDGDDAAAIYCLKGVVAYVRAAVGSAKDLQALKAREPA